MWPLIPSGNIAPMFYPLLYTKRGQGRQGGGRYSGTSPYGHLYNTDTSLLRTVDFVPERPKSI